MARMADYTDQDKDLIRQGVFGALGYVSKAQPGFFAAFSESMAGAKALAAAPAEVQEILKGGFTVPAASSPQEFDASVVPNLRAAVELVESRDPAAAAALRQVVLTAVNEVASASKGVSAEEQAAITRLQEALS